MQRKINDSFINAYSIKFSDKITNSFFEENETINGKEIISLTPSKQINFFVLKTLFTKWQDELRRLESPYFDFKNPEVRKALVTFMNSLSQKILIKKEDFKPLLCDATAEMLLLLADPRNYLKDQFAGDADGNISNKSVKTFLNYIKVLKSEYEDILTSSDNIDSMNTAADRFFENAELSPIIDFELSVLSEVEPIKFDALFEENQIEEQKDENEVPDLEVDFDDDQEEEITPEASVSEGEIPSEETATDPAKDADDDEEEDEREAADIPVEEREEEKIEEEELQETIVDAPEEVEITTEKDASGDIGEHDEEDKEAKLEDDEPPVSNDDLSLNKKLAEKPSKTINETFEKEEETVINQHQQGKVGSIMEAISVNNRYMFIKELFEGDSDEFNDAIEDLETCTSFDDAVEMLVQTHAKNLDWDMNSNEVKELLKVIFRKFR